MSTKTRRSYTEAFKEDAVCLVRELGDPGKNMKTAHKSMKITGAAFDALVQDLTEALDTFNAPAQEKGELLGVLGPMKKDILEIP